MADTKVVRRNGPGRTWNAEDFAGFITDFLEDGIDNLNGDNSDLGVQPQSPLAMGITVSGGRCYMGVTVSGMSYKERLELTGATNVAVTDNATGDDRVDPVIARIDVDVAPDADASNMGAVEVLVGTGNTPMTDNDIQTAIGSDSFLRLCDITVPNGAVEIDTGDVADTRVKVRITPSVSRGDYDEDVDGIKTFLQSPLLPAGTPASNLAAVTKAYVLAQLASSEIDIDYTSGEDITAGAPVSISSVASVVVNSVQSILSDAGTESAFDIDSCDQMKSCNVANGKIAAIYRNITDSKAYLIIGTVSADKTVTWGTPVEISTTVPGALAICKLSDNKIAVSYVYGSEGYVRIATVSGLVPTLGSEASIGSGGAVYTGVALINTNKVIVVYDDAGDTSKGKAKVVTISGTTATVEDAGVTTFEAGATKYVSVVKFDTDKAGVFYQDDDDGDKGKGALLIATGTSLAANTPVDIDSNISSYFSVAALETDKALVVWAGGASGYVQSRVASLSGLTISYGTVEEANAAVGAYVSVDTIDSGTAFVAYEESGDSEGKFNQLEISGTGVAAGTQYEINGGTNLVSFTSIAKVSDNDKFIILYRDESDSDKGNAEAYQSYDNMPECVGFAQSTVVESQTVVVRSKGLCPNQTGLVVGAVHYLKSGGVETTNNSSVRAGVAKTTTDIDIDIDSNNGISVSDAETLTGGGNADLLHDHVAKGEYARGSFQRAQADPTGDVNIPHGMSVPPKLVAFKVFPSQSTNGGATMFHGSRDAGSESCIANSPASPVVQGQSVSISWGDGTNGQQATCTVDATNIILSWTKTGTGVGTPNATNWDVIWEAFA